MQREEALVIVMELWSSGENNLQVASHYCMCSLSLQLRLDSRGAGKQTGDGRDIAHHCSWSRKCHHGVCDVRVHGCKRFLTCLTQHGAGQFNLSLVCREEGDGRAAKRQRIIASEANGPGDGPVSTARSGLPAPNLPLPVCLKS